MNLTKQIRDQIDQIPEGKTFGYSDLQIERESYQTAAKVMERLLSKGYIRKISKGIFFKPEQSVFGELQPSYSEQLRPYLFKNGSRIAYETGDSLYNKMGLTTQMAFRIKIASLSKRININRGIIKADAVKSYAEVTDANYELLSFLDAIKDVKRIPDCSVSQAVKILSGKINHLNDRQIEELTSYAMLYPPRVRALLGAILENLKIKADTSRLRKSLNPLTKINLGLKKTDLPTKNSWNIE